MATEPTWIAPAASSVTILLAVIGIGWRAAKGSGQDSITLQNLCKDMEAQKLVTADYAKTLAAHTTLHESESGDIEDLQDRMQQLEQGHSELKGQVNANTHRRSG